MRTLLLSLIWLCAITGFAANPAFQDFYGTNGIVIRTNGNKVQVDGSALASTNSLSNANIWTNTSTFIRPTSATLSTNANIRNSDGSLFSGLGADGYLTTLGFTKSTANYFPLVAVGNTNELSWHFDVGQLVSESSFASGVIVGSGSYTPGNSQVNSLLSVRAWGLANNTTINAEANNVSGNNYATVNLNNPSGVDVDIRVSDQLGAKITLGSTFAVTNDGNISLIRNVGYGWPSAQGAFDTFLRNDGNGSLSWTTNVSLLNVTNITVQQNLTVKGDLFVTNLVLGGANVRTNQYTTNVSGTPVIGSFWFGGTNGVSVTNGPRFGLEFIPFKQSIRSGSVGAQGAGHDSIDTESVSNYWNYTNSGASSVGLGSNNWVWGNYSTIANGLFNIISTNAFASFIGSGSNNIIHTNSMFSFIGSGDINKIRMNSRGSVIVGGSANDILDSDYATIGGGVSCDIITCDYATISGGSVNVIQVSSPGSTIGGGDNNTIIESDFATIPGGDDNDIISTSDYATIGGGTLNDIASASYGTIAGGQANQMSGIRGFIGGGNANFVASDAATIGGGIQNFVSTSSGLSAVLGGASNFISVAAASIVGNFLTNTTKASTVFIGHGANGGNNRRLEVSQNGARVITYNGSATVGGTYLITNTPIASAGAAETNLQQVTIGAHVLTNNNDRLIVRASGRFAATGNAKQVKLVYGSETVIDSSSQVNNGGAWTIDAEIIRTGNTSHTVNGTFNGGTNIFFTRASSETLAQTNGIATVLKITSTADGDGDVTNRTLTVEWRPAP